MYYIIGDGQIIEQQDSCPTDDDLKYLADICNLDELWVIDGQHSGITYERPKSEHKTKSPRPAFAWNG